MHPVRFRPIAIDLASPVVLHSMSQYEPAVSQWVPTHNKNVVKGKRNTQLNILGTSFAINHFQQTLYLVVPIISSKYSNMPVS